MIDVNSTNSLLHPKIVGQSIEDSEHFRATNANFNNRTATTKNEFMSKDDDYEYCPNCSRKFFVGRLQLHLKSCKEGKPLKPVKGKNNEKPGSMNDGNNEFATPENEKTPELDRKKSTNASGFYNQSSLQERSQELVSKYLQSALMDNNERQPTVESQYKNPSNFGGYSYLPKEESGTLQEEEEGNEEAENAENAEEPEERPQQEMEDQGERVPCSQCGRKFAADRVEKHEVACAKSNKKRKVFDMSKQRAIPEQAEIKPTKEAPSKAKKGTASAIKETPNKENKEQNTQEEKPLKKTPAWKVEHENFIKNIRFNRKVKAMEANGEDTSNLVAPTIVNENYVHCPHCNRKFAPATAERHLPKCKNIFNRPKPPKNLNLDKMEDMQRVDRAKINYILKKGVSHRVSPSEGDARKGQSVTAATEGSNQDLDRNGAGSQDKTPKGGPQKPPVYLKSGSKVLLKKQTSAEMSGKRSATTDKKQEAEEGEPITPNSYEVKFEKKTSVRQQSPSGRVYMEPMPKKEELLQNYQSIFERTNTNSNTECPHCSRKFNASAAQRHIPICQDLKTRPLKNVVDRTKSKEGDAKGNMMATKYGFSRQGQGENDEGTPGKVGGISGTSYGNFSKFGKNGERPPLPSGKKAGNGLLGTCEPVIEKASMNKTKIGASGSGSNFCTSCGSKSVRAHKFCGNCGSKK